VPIAAWYGAAPPFETRGGQGRLDVGAGRLRWLGARSELGLELLRGQDAQGNEGSRALLVTWRGERLLLLGDAEEEGLAGLALEPGPLRLLLAPHHGADAPALRPLLERPPALVWISASERPAIAAELDRRRLPWQWTGRDGPLALRLE
jgi:beta-lactamase superfamily II metal-dependent hydrolase